MRLRDGPLPNELACGAQLKTEAHRLSAPRLTSLRSIARHGRLGPAGNSPADGCTQDRSQGENGPRARGAGLASAAALRDGHARRRRSAIPPREGETTMATGAERVRAHRERARRGLRRFTISVSADDLRVIAEHGYEGAASTDHDCRSQAISRFISDTVACLDRTG